MRQELTNGEESGGGNLKLGPVGACVRACVRPFFEVFPQLLTNYKLPRVRGECIPAKFGGAMEGLERIWGGRLNIACMACFLYRVPRS